jgi:hypothetical protein
MERMTPHINEMEKKAMFETTNQIFIWDVMG